MFTALHTRRFNVQADYYSCFANKSHNHGRFIPIIFKFCTRFLRLLLWFQNLLVNLATPLDTNSFATLVLILLQTAIVRRSFTRKRWKSDLNELRSPFFIRTRPASMRGRHRHLACYSSVSSPIRNLSTIRPSTIQPSIPSIESHVFLFIVIVESINFLPVLCNSFATSNATVCIATFYHNPAIDILLQNEFIVVWNVTLGSTISIATNFFRQGWH
jgi:hypothetical protein